MADPAMAPLEYTPEISDAYLQKLMRPIDDEENMRVGQSRGEALARGLEGTPTETGGTAAARAYSDRERNDLRGDMAFKLAGMQREERLGAVQRDWQGQQNNADREIQREGQWAGLESLARTNNYAQKNALWQIPAGLASSAIGGAAGGYGAKLAMSDRRFKKVLRRLGEHLGLGVYEFEYRPEAKQRAGIHIGFMADEVEAIFPEAVVTLGGIKHVDYGYLGAL